jgi:tetratricopeptide (TPR) repeat protein
MGRTWTYAWLVLLLLPAVAAAQTERADSAWAAGNQALAAELYAQRLDAAPDDVHALRRLAQLRAWAGAYDASLELYARILRLAPDDRDALLGRAQALAWSRRYPESRAIYAQFLAADPRDAAALRGLARLAGWSGDLAAGEAYWRRALEIEPADAESLIGLGANLRWQGRASAAQDVLEQARALEPGNADLAVELAHIRAMVAPRSAPLLVHESDSDGNRAQTLSTSGAWRAARGVELRGEAYHRWLEGPVLPGDPSRLRAYGGTAGAALEIGGGWTTTAAAGLSTTDATGARTHPAVRASLASPLAPRAAGWLAFALQAFDATAAVAARGITTEQLSAELLYRVLPQWSLTAGSSTTVFNGSTRNRQVAGSLTSLYRVSPSFAAGITARGFTFEQSRVELFEGYFNPDFFGVLEATSYLDHAAGRWLLAAEAAPGIQQVGRDGERGVSLRALGRLTYRIEPGREVGFSALFANSAMQQFSDAAAAEYRYHALSLFARWLF